MRHSSTSLGHLSLLIAPGAFALMLHASPGFAADKTDSIDPRQAYRFVIKAEGGGTTTIHGLITVDGKDRLIEKEKTPFEFRCESGAVVAGFFEALEAGREMKLSVFDPEYSKRRVALSMKGYDRLRFSWARPGVGPRCADTGEGACPESTPSVEAFRKRLLALQEPG